MKGISFIIPIKVFTRKIYEKIVLDKKNIKNQFENFEIIVCYKELDKNISILNKLHKCKIFKQKSSESNIFHAVNEALQISKFQYLYIYGEDDKLIYPSFKKILNDHKIDKIKPSMIITNSFLPIKIIDRFKLSLRLREFCQQNIIYSKIAFKKDLFNENLSINADHLHHLKLIRNKDPIFFYPISICQVGKKGISSFYFNNMYRLSKCSLRYEYAGCIFGCYYSLISLIRRIRAKKARQIAIRKNAVHIFLLGNDFNLLFNSLSYLSISIYKLPMKYRQIIKTINITIDMESISDLEFYILKNINVDFNLVKYFKNKNDLVRSDMRNFAVNKLFRKINLDESSLLFFDGDVLVSKSLLMEYINKSFIRNLVIGDTYYLPFQKSNRTIQIKNIKIRFRIIALISSFKRIIASYILYLPFSPFSKFQPTLGAGNFMIRFELFKSLGKFVPLNKGWGGEDVYLGFRAYTNGFYPKHTSLLNSAFHQYHKTDIKQKNIVNKAVRQKLKKL